MSFEMGNYNNATLRYTPVPSDVGKNITMSVLYGCSYHPFCMSWTVVVTVTNQPPVLTANGMYSAPTLYKHFVKSDITATDADVCDNLAFSLVSGIGSIDPLTGVYTLDTQPEHIGLHDIIVAVTDGIISVQDTFSVYVRDMLDSPGNANCNGSVDVGDAIYIVNYIFRAGPRPPILNWADPNNDCKITIGDAVYLINYIFRNGPEPGPGCMEQP